MRLNKVRVKGFQSFSDSGVVSFSSGINLVVGQNNSGKSAFLRAMQPGLMDDRHRKPSRWKSHELPLPEVILEIAVSGSELVSAILQHGATFVPIPIPTSELATSELLSKLWDSEKTCFEIKNLPQHSFTSLRYPSHQLFNWREGDGSAATQICITNAKLSAGAITHGLIDEIPSIIQEIWQREMFYFKAERFGLGKTSPHYADRLAADASNLPVILLALQGSQGTVFQNLVSHLRTIFPTVGNLSIWTAPNNQLEILIWPTETMTRRELAFPLEESGTGVAQVIAILAAILTKDQAVFIIDEINSFLHPAAVKTLLRILQTEYAHHQ